MKPSVNKIMLLITIALMDLLTGMEFDLFVPSFPELQDQFNLSPFWVEALLSVNFIGYALSLFFVGMLADHYGRKPMIVLGLVTFVVGTLCCLWAPSYEFLLLGRFLQGMGVAAPSILSFLIIADAYSMKEQQFWLAMMNGLMNTAVAISPVLGSYITLYFHWRGNFVALLVLGLLTLMMTAFFVPHHRLQVRHDTLSLQGYIAVFKSKPLMLLILNIVFIIVPYWIFVGMSPLLYMENLGVSLAHFGYYQGALALVFAAGSVIYGLMLSKVSQQKMLYLSGLFFVISLGTIGWATVTDTPNPLYITFALLPFIIGQIVPSTVLYPLSLNVIPEAKGRVSAMIQGGRLLLSALGLQLAGHYYVGSFQHLGLVIMGFIMVMLITLVLVFKNREIMHVCGGK